MERELSWRDLVEIIQAHEAFHNFGVLSAFCARYYPGATRVIVRAMQEYDDNSYYYTFGPSSIAAYRQAAALTLPEDEVSLLLLLGQSPQLKRELEAAAPEDPVLWLADLYYDEAGELELCGIERGDDLEVDLLAAPPAPRRVYAKDA